MLKDNYTFTELSNAVYILIFQTCYIEYNSAGT